MQLLYNLPDLNLPSVIPAENMSRHLQILLLSLLFIGVTFGFNSQFTTANLPATANALVCPGKFKKSHKHTRKVLPAYLRSAAKSLGGKIAIVRFHPSGAGVHTSSCLKSQEKDEDGPGNKSPSEEQKPSIFIHAVEIISLFVSYCIQFLGVAFSLGLVLNLCGFAYTFDLEHGLEIDRIENVRKEQQFRREMLKVTDVKQGEIQVNNLK